MEDKLNYADKAFIVILGIITIMFYALTIYLADLTLTFWSMLTMVGACVFGVPSAFGVIAWVQDSKKAK